MHLRKQGTIYSQENLSTCPQQSSQTLEKAELLVLLGRCASDPWSATKEPRESRRKEYRDQVLSFVLYNTLLGRSVCVTVAFWDFFLLVKMKLVLQISSPDPSTGQSCICISTVLSSLMLHFHTWILWPLFTSGLTSLVLFPLYPG